MVLHNANGILRWNRQKRHNPGSMKQMAAFAVRTLIVAFGLMLFPLPLTAQSQYSKSGATAIMQTKDWHRLLAYCQGWTKTEPNNADAWFCVGRAYGSKQYNIGLGQPAEAASAYQRSVKLNPQSPEAWHALGLMAQELGQWKESVAALEHAVQITPQRTNSWDFLCASYMHTHQFQQAANAGENIERYARTATEWFQAGTCFYAVAPYYEPIPMYQKSKKAFQRVLQIEPQNGAAWTNLGTCEQALGNTDAAFANYQKGARLGNRQGAMNDANLRADIQACMIQRNNLISQNVFMKASTMGMIITSYNNRCARYTGEIKILYAP